jgi:hypothetical protein
MERNRTLPPALAIAAQGHAQNVGDYNTNGSGNWNSVSTWLRFNGTDFVAAPSVPTASDGQVVILPGHTVTVNTAVTMSCSWPQAPR